MSAEFKNFGASIVGISPDPVGRQNEFAAKNDLGFPLLSDRKKVVAKAFGIKRAGPLPIQRATFVIAQDRTVLAAIKNELDMNAHADQALEILQLVE